MDIHWSAMSRVVHAVDESKKHPKRSGQRALCGRYPFRNAFPWFTLSDSEPSLDKAIRSYQLVKCVDCIVRLNHLKEQTNE